jgi:hypothetical protein
MTVADMVFMDVNLRGPFHRARGLRADAVPRQPMRKISLKQANEAPHEQNAHALSRWNAQPGPAQCRQNIHRLQGIPRIPIRSLYCKGVSSSANGSAMRKGVRF